MTQEIKYVNSPDCTSWLTKENQENALHYKVWNEQAKKTQAQSTRQIINTLSPEAKHKLDWSRLTTKIKLAEEEKNTKEIEKLALERKVANVTRYISWQNFLTTFETLLKSFLTEIQNEPFLLLLPTYREIDNSDFWMTFLTHVLLRRYQHPQYATCSIVDCLYKYPKIKHVLVVSDVIYSGQQMEVIIETIARTEAKFDQVCEIASPPKHYHILSSFCGSYGVERVLRQIRKHKLSSRIDLYCGETMQPLGAYLSKEDLTAFEDNNLADSFGRGLYPYVFQHKLADRVSTYPGFYRNYMTDCEEGHRQCFDPIYKKLWK
jgi:hypothetical protein